MNKISIFVLSTIALLVVSCGGSSKYDNEKLGKLSEKYFNDGKLTEEEWKEVSVLYSAGADEIVKLDSEILEKIKPDMTMEEAQKICAESLKEYSSINISKLIFSGAEDIKDSDVRRSLEETQKKLANFSENLANQIRKKIGLDSDESEETAEVEEVEASSQEFILTKDGLGPFTLGMSKNDVPASIPGLYDSTSYSTFNHEEDMDIPLFIHGWMTFSLNGENRFAITFDDKGKAIQISVQSPEIPTSLGITTASSVEKAAALPGAQVVDHAYVEGYEVDGFTIYCYGGITSIAIGEQY